MEALSSFSVHPLHSLSSPPPFPFTGLPLLLSFYMATSSKLTPSFAPALTQNYPIIPPWTVVLRRPVLTTTSNLNASLTRNHHNSTPITHRIIKCKATDLSVAEKSSSSGDGGENWVPVVPLSALPRGERRVIIQEGETILLLWYKDEVFAIENKSPAEGAYTEGLLNAKLTKDGCIVCPTTDSTFDLRTGSIKEWYPKNPVLRVLTPALRSLFVYPVKIDEENIYINIRGSVKSDATAEIVFSGKAQPGVTATDVNVDEVRMVVDDNLEGFGFTGRNELINGKAAAIGFLLLLDFELLTGKGLLKGTGFLDFIYSISNALK